MAAAKEDPETLVLRGSPRPVVRFRRGLIIGLTGAVAASLVAITWFALEPAGFRIAAHEEGDVDSSKAPPDALAGAPASYGDVPRLGPRRVSGSATSSISHGIASILIGGS